jgi:hypothetical protein
MHQSVAGIQLFGLSAKRGAPYHFGCWRYIFRSAAGNILSDRDWQPSWFPISAAAWSTLPCFQVYFLALGHYIVGKAG